MKSQPEPAKQSFDGLESENIEGTKYFYCPTCFKNARIALEQFLLKADKDLQILKTDESKKELTSKLDSNSKKENWKNYLKKLFSEKSVVEHSKELEKSAAENETNNDIEFFQVNLKHFRRSLEDNIEDKMEKVFSKDFRNSFKQLEVSFGQFCSDPDKPFFSSQLFQLSKDIQSIEAEVKTIHESVKTLQPDLLSLNSMLETTNKNLNSDVSDKKDQNLDSCKELLKASEDWKKLFEQSLELRLGIDLCKEKIDKLDFENLFNSVKDTVESVKQAFSGICKFSPPVETISPSNPHSTGISQCGISNIQNKEDETQSEYESKDIILKVFEKITMDSPPS